MLKLHVTTVSVHASDVHGYSGGRYSGGRWHLGMVYGGEPGQIAQESSTGTHQGPLKAAFWAHFLVLDLISNTASEQVVAFTKCRFEQTARKANMPWQPLKDLQRTVWRFLTHLLSILQVLTDLGVIIRELRAVNTINNC